jgi:hypothetical protein
MPKYVKINTTASGALGGKARAAGMSPAKRKAAARKAANARWAAVRAAKEGAA